MSRVEQYCGILWYSNVLWNVIIVIIRCKLDLKGCKCVKGSYGKTSVTKNAINWHACSTPAFKYWRIWEDCDVLSSRDDSHCRLIYIIAFPQKLCLKDILNTKTGLCWETGWDFTRDMVLKLLVTKSLLDCCLMSEWILRKKTPWNPNCKVFQNCCYVICNKAWENKMRRAFIWLSVKYLWQVLLTFKRHPRS